jgi:hypothetical protein
MFVRELSSSHPGSSLHATPEHVRRSGKQCERAQLLHDDEDGLRQGRMQLDRVQDARLTQHVAQPSVKPSRVTHDCMHEVPLMMHEIAQPWMSDCRWSKELHTVERSVVLHEPPADLTDDGAAEATAMHSREEVTRAMVVPCLQR